MNASRVTRHSSLVIAAALALCAAGGFAATDPEFFGVCEHFTNQRDVYASHRRLMTLCARDGFKWVRADFQWSQCEPSRGRWEWAGFDAVMASAAARGIDVLPILDFGNAYDGTNARRYVADDEMDAWATYVTNFVTRYRGQLKAVEVWNEPELEIFWTGGSTANSGSRTQYVKLLRRTYAAVKSVDANIQVLMAGLTSGAAESPSVLREFLSKGATNCFDVLSIHPYVGDPERGTPSLATRISQFRAVLNDGQYPGCATKPIWITEIGWPTAGARSVGEDTQASYITSAMAIARNLGIEKFFIYELVAQEFDDNRERHFGVLHNSYSNYTFKAAWGAVRDYIYRETHGGSADPCVSSAYLIAGDASPASSFGAAGNWSDAAAPRPDMDYLVDLGDYDDAALHTPAVENATAVFTGRSLALGRVGGRAGGLWHEGAGSTATVAALTLNKGRIVPRGGTGGAGQTLAGAVAVASPLADPFTIEGMAASRRYVVSASLSGDAGTAIRGAVRDGDTGAALDLSFTGDASSYAGAFVAKGERVTLRLDPAAMRAPAGAGAITLRGGATFAPLASAALSARALVAEEGVGVIDVPEGVTLTLACPVSGAFRKTGSGTLVLDGATVTGEIDAEAGRVIDAADSFEDTTSGTEASGLPGWSGEGVIAGGTPTTGDPPGFPLPAETHARILELDSETAARSYPAAGARGNSQSIDFLVQATRHTDDSWRESFPADGTFQIHLLFDAEGAPCILHADDTGAPVWTRLGISIAAGGAENAAPMTVAQGAWVRVSIDFDYATNPDGFAFAQLRLDGSCLLAAAGWRTPAARGTGGSWFRLPALATSARRVSVIQFAGDCGIDDLVLAHHSPGRSPDFATGAVTTTNGIPFAWFDAAGIPRDPGGDPDGDDALNRQEWLSGTDPLARASHPPTRTFLVLQ